MIPTVGRLDAAWKSLTQDHSLQFEFPKIPRQGQPPGWLTSLMKWLGAHSEWFRYGAWALLACLLTVGLWRLIVSLRTRGPAKRAAAPDTAAPQWQPSPERARLLLADADALAARGQYGEAAHHLLLAYIQEISERWPGLVRRALTSREIANLAELSAPARKVFSLIAAIVEKAVFANRNLGAEEFQLCRQAFERFVIPNTWRGAA